MINWLVTFNDSSNTIVMCASNVVGVFIYNLENDDEDRFRNHVGV